MFLLAEHQRPTDVHTEPDHGLFLCKYLFLHLFQRCQQLHPDIYLSTDPIRILDQGKIIATDDI